MAIIESSSEDLRKFVYDKQYVIVKFHTVDKCPACDKLLPVFKRLSEDYKNITFVLMDSDNNPTAKKLIRKTKKPFIGVYKDGMLVDCGIVSTEKELVHVLNKLPNIKFSF